MTLYVSNVCGSIGRAKQIKESPSEIEINAESWPKREIEPVLALSRIESNRTVSNQRFFLSQKLYSTICNVTHTDWAIDGFAVVAEIPQQQKKKKITTKFPMCMLSLFDSVGLQSNNDIVLYT